MRFKYLMPFYDSDPLWIRKIFDLRKYVMNKHEHHVFLTWCSFSSYIDKLLKVKTTITNIHLKLVQKFQYSQLGTLVSRISVRSLFSVDIKNFRLFKGKFNAYRISSYNFLMLGCGNYSSFQYIRENLMPKLYEIYKVLKTQKKYVVSAETIRGNTGTY